MGISIKWDTTYQCTSMCKFCINANHLSHDETHVNASEALRIIKLIASEIPLDFIQFLGPNPLADKDFVTLLKGLDETNIAFSFQIDSSFFTTEPISFLTSFKNLAYVTLTSSDSATPTVIPIHSTSPVAMQHSVEVCPKKIFNDHLNLLSHLF